MREAPKRGHSQVCFPRVTMLDFISLQILLPALARALLPLAAKRVSRLPTCLRVVPYLSSFLSVLSLSACTSTVAILAFVRPCCVACAIGV